MSQWSHKIPARDKFSSVPKRGHAIVNVFRTILNDITYRESRFYFSKPSQREKPSTETSKQRDENSVHPP